MSAKITWPSQAPVEVRTRLAAELARAMANTSLDLGTRCAIETALSLAAQDFAPRVRLALAEAIGTLPNVPTHIIAQLAVDRPDISGIVLSRSPSLTNDDLLELAPRLDPRVLPIAALRARTVELATLLVEIGDGPSAAALLENPTIALTTTLLDRIAEAHGHNPIVRARLLARDDLSIGARYALVEALCSVLSTTGIVSNILGDRRSDAIMHDACSGALIAACEGRTSREVDQLVEEVGERGRIDSSVILRALCNGENELFASFVAYVSGVSRNRTRSILKGVRRNALKGMFERCDMSETCATFFADCTVLVARMPRSCGPAEVTSRVLEAMKPTCAETSMLLAAARRWHVDALRRGATHMAGAYATAA